jgi:hypothetical protein
MMSQESTHRLQIINSDLELLIVKNIVEESPDLKSKMSSKDLKRNSILIRKSSKQTLMNDLIQNTKPMHRYWRKFSLNDDDNILPKDEETKSNESKYFRILVNDQLKDMSRTETSDNDQYHHSSFAKTFVVEYICSSKVHSMKNEDLCYVSDMSLPHQIECSNVHIQIAKMTWIFKVSGDIRWCVGIASHHVTEQSSEISLEDFIGGYMNIKMIDLKNDNEDNDLSIVSMHESNVELSVDMMTSLMTLRVNGIINHTKSFDSSLPITLLFIGKKQCVVEFYKMNRFYSDTSPQYIPLDKGPLNVDPQQIGSTYHLQV